MKKTVRHGNLTALLLQPGEWGEESTWTVPAAHLQSWEGLSDCFPMVTAASRASCRSSLVGPASLSGLAETMCSTRMTPDSIWFCHFKNFPPPIWLLWSLQMTDWENRLLEKHLQVVLKGWLPHQAAGKAVQSASRWTKRMCTVPPNSKHRWRGRDEKRRGHKVTRSAAVCVCCFWLIGVFCFCVCSVLTKGLLPLLHGSCLIQSWIISSCWNHSSRMDRTISWWLV